MFSFNMDSLGYQPLKLLNYAFVLSLYLKDVINGVLIVLGLFLIPFCVYVLGLRIYYFKPHQMSYNIFIY